jgi:hypothetical protein
MRKSMRLLALLFLALPLLSQQGQPVRVVDDPPPDAVQKVLIVNGSNQTTAVCSARSSVTTGQRASFQVAISAVSKANPAVVTSTGHGFNVSSLPKVTISGATGTGWTGINATWTATIIDANTFSIPIDSTGFGTLAGSVIFTTTGPRTTVPEWAVAMITYDGSGNVNWTGWLNGSTGYTNKCSDATLSGANRQ